ncbi:hypothetical protein BRADI_1g55405v3 [Brachypodium distachyon]|uniref:Uncharacterized protein n=1 Tax=Brachypodium distachyon TaxID=15368 RepID=A0A2K2DRJ0_BRADI|nr:hypothetical protein BRADI_1g55405v3 [Brachypodium distachyon]
MHLPLWKFLLLPFADPVMPWWRIGLTRNAPHYVTFICSNNASHGVHSLYYFSLISWFMQKRFFYSDLLIGVCFGSVTRDLFSSQVSYLII